MYRTCADTGLLQHLTAPPMGFPVTAMIPVVELHWSTHTVSSRAPNIKGLTLTGEEQGLNPAMEDRLQNDQANTYNTPIHDLSLVKECLGWGDGSVS